MALSIILKASIYLMRKLTFSSLKYTFSQWAVFGLVLFSYLPQKEYSYPNYIYIKETSPPTTSTSPPFSTWLPREIKIFFYKTWIEKQGFEKLPILLSFFYVPSSRHIITRGLTFFWYIKKAQNNWILLDLELRFRTIWTTFRFGLPI